MELTYEQHKAIRKMIREKCEKYDLRFAVVSRAVGLQSNVLSKYLNGCRVLSPQTIKKVFKWLNLDFSEFQATEQEVTTDVFVVKRGDFYYGGKKKKRQYSFGRIEFFVEVYTARQEKAKVFSNLRIARRVAKQIDGQVIRLEKRKW